VTDPAHSKVVLDGSSLRLEDLVRVARDPQRFSAERGGVVLEDLPPESLEMMRGMLLAMDPPRHVTYRRPLADTFKAKVIAGLEPQIRAICRDLMAEAAAAASAMSSRQMARICGSMPAMTLALKVSARGRR